MKSGWLTFERRLAIKGIPLPEWMAGIEFRDAAGQVVGKLEGLKIRAGEGLIEAIKRATPVGCYAVMDGSKI